jgi:hypothetical protein
MKNHKEIKPSKQTKINQFNGLSITRTNEIKLKRMESK